MPCVCQYDMPDGMSANAGPHLIHCCHSTSQRLRLQDFAANAAALCVSEALLQSFTTLGVVSLPLSSSTCTQWWCHCCFVHV